MKKPVTYKFKEELPMILNDPISLYLPNSFSKSSVLDNLAKSSKDLFMSLLNSSGLTIKTLAENIFEITPKTFIKYKNNSLKVPSRIAELAIELDLLYQQGNLIFGNSETFNLWLEKENQFFNNKKPSSFLNTSTGIHLIFEELKRIEFGATA